MVNTLTCHDRPRQAERRLNEEVERVANYLDPSTEAKLTRVAEQELIHNQVPVGWLGRGVLEWTLGFRVTRRRPVSECRVSGTLLQQVYKAGPSCHCSTAPRRPSLREKTDLRSACRRQKRALTAAVDSSMLLVIQYARCYGLQRPVRRRCAALSVNPSRWCWSPNAAPQQHGRPPAQLCCRSGWHLPALSSSPA